MNHNALAPAPTTPAAYHKGKDAIETALNGQADSGIEVDHKSFNTDSGVIHLEETRVALPGNELHLRRNSGAGITVDHISATTTTESGAVYHAKDLRRKTGTRDQFEPTGEVIIEQDGISRKLTGPQAGDIGATIVSRVANKIAEHTGEK